MDPNRITYFGETDARNKKIRFGIKSKDRSRHMYVIGKTGMGKSVLLENLAIQDIQNGEGLAFIDPHGGTAEKLLDYVPEHRIKDVLYFAPFDLEHPVSFNVLEDIGIDKRHLVVNGLMSTFEKIWVDAWSARMAYILNNTLLALLEYPNATLLGVNRMLADKEYRKKVVDNVKDPSVKAFWIEEFGKYTERFAAEATPAIQNKVGQFTSNPLVRNLIGQPESSFNIRKFMDEKKILIINLSKGLVGEGNANLIGSMLITKIYLAAMSRADKNEKELAQLPNFYLYVDEFQSFANKSFADILSEARKYKLNLTIAHQYVEQMEEEVRNAVFGNAGTMVTFRVGAFDAEVLEKEFAPVFTAEDLVNLGKYQVYLKLMIDGVASQPFSATTMAPIARPGIIFKDQVIENSRKQFARPRSEVEKGIQDWHDLGTPREVQSSENKDASRGNNSYTGNNQSSSNREGGGNRDFPRSNGSLRSDQVRDQGKDSTKGEHSNTNRATQTNSTTKASSQPKSSKIDQNKMVFMKAAEELKSKIEPIPTAIPEATSSSQPVQKIEPISLSALKREDKKIPTKENLSSLKNALADVIRKTSQEEKKSETSTGNTSSHTEHVHVKRKHKEKLDEKKPEEIKKETHSHDHKKEEEKEKPKSPKEVPEDVLRELLDMEKKNKIL